MTSLALVESNLTVSTAKEKRFVKFNARRKQLIDNVGTHYNLCHTKQSVASPAPAPCKRSASLLEEATRTRLEHYVVMSQLLL